MVVVPLTMSEEEFEMEPSAPETESTNWVVVAAGGTLIAGGLLLLLGRRRAGLVAAAAGATLALLDQQETVLSWWNTLPGFIDDVQGLLGQVEGTVEEIAAQREKLRQVLGR
jgi:LPXTG-motif cell wall-anchored protein